MKSNRSNIPVSRLIKYPPKFFASIFAFKRVLPWMVVCAMILGTGCSTDWGKKFIRKRTKPPKTPQFETRQAVSQSSYAELYKQHFNFWKSWHRQLLDDLGGNRKREAQAIRESRRHLIYLEKYLKEEKAKEVRPLVEKLDELVAPVLAGRMTASDYSILTRRIESLGLQVERRLHYKTVTNFLLPTPLLINLDDYRGDEPSVGTLDEIKSEPASADSGKDESSDQFTYEKYRTLPVS